MTVFVTFIDALIKDQSNSYKDNNIGKIMDAVILLVNGLDCLVQCNVI